MPRYYFNIRDGAGLGRDDEGMELAELHAAREEAMASARDLVIDSMRSGTSIAGQKIGITDMARNSCRYSRNTSCQ